MALMTALAASLLSYRAGNDPTKALIAGIIGCAAMIVLIVAVELLFYRRRNPLKVTFAEERVHPFQFKALIIERRLKIVNRTDYEKKLNAVMIRRPTGGLVTTFDADVMREIDRLKGTHTPFPTRVDAYDTIHGWVVMVFAHRPSGGVPAYEISVRDERGDEYFRKQRERPKKRTTR